MSRRFGMDSYQRREELELSGYCKPNGIRWGSKSSPGVGAAKTVRPVVLCCIWLKLDTSARSDGSPLLRGSNPDPSSAVSFGTKALGKARCYRSLCARRDKVMGIYMPPPPEGKIGIP